MSGDAARTETLGQLSDIVADGRFVVFTGAGVSAELTVQGKPGRRLPQWPELLGRLRDEFLGQLADRDLADLEALLHDRATADELIEAATVLAEAVEPKRLDAAVRRHVTTRPDACTATHERIVALEPKGIVTLNYDDAHEAALRRRGVLPAWTVIESAADEDTLRGLVESRFESRFLLKAHGSVRSTPTLVLSGESFRELHAKAPAYRAFLRHLVTEFNFVFIGFGLQDPDFAQCLNELSHAYGGPVRNHILITRRPVAPASGKDIPALHLRAQAAREVFVRRRYGIHTLRVDEYPDIPRLLDDTLSIDGPQIRRIVGDCLSRDIETRRAAHRRLAALNPNGKKRATSVFGRLMNDLLRKTRLSPDDEFRLSELIYALGTISRLTEVKEMLLKIALETSHKEALAHAMVALFPAVRPSDMARLQEILRRATSDGFADAMSLPDPLRRLPTYAGTLIALARARDDAARTLPAALSGPRRRSPGPGSGRRRRPR